MRPKLEVWCYRVKFHSSHWRSWTKAQSLVLFHFQGVSNFAAVYKLLWSMIRENLLADLDDPLSRHDRNLGALTLLQKKVKSGRFAKNAQKKEDQSLVDPAVSVFIFSSRSESSKFGFFHPSKIFVIFSSFLIFWELKITYLLIISKSFLLFMIFNYLFIIFQRFSYSSEFLAQALEFIFFRVLFPKKLIFKNIIDF